jgi:hypothetical protein
MLKIIGFSKNKPCFLTGKTGPDIVEVRFLDKSFAGSLSWDELLKVMKRKAAENEEAKRDVEQTNSMTISKSS